MGKVCNKTFSRTNAKWARSALKTHQNSSVHRPNKRKAFTCDKCDSRYSFPEDLQKCRGKAQGVGVRVAVFSDEESEMFPTSATLALHHVPGSDATSLADGMALDVKGDSHQSEWLDLGTTRDSRGNCVWFQHST